MLARASRRDADEAPEASARDRPGGCSCRWKTNPAASRARRGSTIAALSDAAAALAAPFRFPAEQPRLAILAPVGEIDPLGTRRDGLDAFLDQKADEGYVIETRSGTHAIIFRRPKGLKRFTSGRDPGRYVVQVDEDGVATMRPAEPRRT
jgi:hypothetical protein